MRTRRSARQYGPSIPPREPSPPKTRRVFGGPKVHSWLTVVGLSLTAFSPAFATPSPAKSAIRTQVEGIKVRDGGRQVVIQTSASPEFSLFRMTEPYRILVDVSGADLGPAIGSVTQGKGIVRSVTPSSFDDGRQTIARIEIELAKKTTYEAKARGNSIVVNINSAGFTPPTPAAPKTKATQLGRLRISRHDTRTVLRAPFEGVSLKSDAVNMETLSDPGRLVIDLEGAILTPKWQRLKVDRHGVRRARAAVRGDGVRVVLDLEDSADFPQVAVDVVQGFMDITIEAPIRVQTTPVLASVTEHRAVGATAAVRTAAPSTLGLDTKPAPTAAPSTPRRTKKSRGPARNKVSNISFEPKDAFYRLTVEFKGGANFRVARGGSESAPLLRIPSVALPESLERTMDVSAIAGDALSSVSTYLEDGDLVIAARIMDKTEHRHWTKKNRFMWDFRSTAPRVLSYEAESTASYASSTARTAGTLSPRRERYGGRRISLDLKDAEIQNVLRLLADVSKLNIVASDDVKGTITIKLRNVPWDQALDIILSAKQLDKIRNGNIIRVAPLKVLRDEEEIRLQRAKAKAELAPLTVRLIPVSYAVAEDIQDQVQALLTLGRGKVSVDKRTNVLIVEDISEVLSKVERLVRTLDTQTPQVLIEARIVEARSNFSRELGVQWGGNASFTQNYGNQTGLSFPSNVRVAGGADDGQNNVTEGVVPNSNYAVNLPATVGAGGGGALGFVFGSLNGGTLVNLRLSAAEATGKIKIVSAPKIVTLDNVEAKIVSGEKVPITVVTANGPTTRYIDANIELNVRPHVTQDGSILMRVNAKKNELSDRIDFLGVPGVLTKEATTQMIVRDGDTAVLGGLYRRNSQENEAYVPWVGRIPVLGWLFKTTSRTDARDELLIFISPRIVNRSEALIAPTEG